MSERAQSLFQRGLLQKIRESARHGKLHSSSLQRLEKGGDVAAAAFNVAVVVVDAEEEEEAFLIDFARGKELPSIVCAPRARFGASTMLRNGKCELRERGAI